MSISFHRIFALIFKHNWNFSSFVHNLIYIQNIFLHKKGIFGNLASNGYIIACQDVQQAI